MPRKKQIKTDERISVLQPDLEIEPIVELNEPTEKPIEQFIDEPVEPKSCPRDYLAASLQATTESIGELFEKQAELQGTQIADAIFDRFESAFISRLEQRLQPFMDVVLPQIQENHVVLKERTTARVERRLSAFDRLKQIAATITDECKLLPPVVAVGEFVNWEPIEVKENE
jgi:hypothetical protein